MEMLFLESNKRSIMKVGLDIFIWDSKKKIDSDIRFTYLELDNKSLGNISKFIYDNKNDFLDGEPDYFINFPEDPEPLSENELIYNPNKLLKYLNSPGWSSLIISFISKLLNWGGNNDSDCLIVGVNSITKKNDDFYLLNISVICKKDNS